MSGTIPIEKYNELQAELTALQKRYMDALQLKIMGPGSEDKNHRRLLMLENAELKDALKKSDAENEALKKRLEEKENYISALKRPIKERSTAARGISDKKGHPGFIITGMSQQIEKINEDTCCELEAWKITMQSFYDNRFMYGPVREELVQDIIDTVFPVLYDCPIQDVRGNAIYDVYDMATKNPDSGFLYKVSARLPGKPAYWVLDLFVTKEAYIPDFMMEPSEKPVKKEEKTGKTVPDKDK